MTNYSKVICLHQGMKWRVFDIEYRRLIENIKEAKLKYEIRAPKGLLEIWYTALDIPRYDLICFYDSDVSSLLALVYLSILLRKKTVICIEDFSLIEIRLRRFLNKNYILRNVSVIVIGHSNKHKKLDIDIQNIVYAENFEKWLLNDVMSKKGSI